MKIAIYHTADLHGYVYPTDYIREQNLGILKIGSYILEDEKNYDSSLKIDCGDLIQGSPLTHYLSKKISKGNKVIDALEKINYNAYIIGNHEFNYGLDYFNNSYSSVANKVINANIEGLSFETKPYKIFDFNGFKVGCIGFTTSYIPNWEHPSNIKDLNFLDPIKTYEKYEEELKSKSDYIIVCYHGGFEKSLDTSMIPTEKLTKENQGSELLEKFSTIDMILSGHQHRSFITTVNGVVCSQPLNNGQNFGKIILDTKSREVSYELVDVGNICNDINPSLEKIFEEENRNLKEYLDKKIGEFNEDSTINDVFDARLNGHPFINFLHEVQLDASNADFSALSIFDNSTGFKKNVSIKDVIVNYPYPNTLVVLKLKGYKIKEAIEKSSTYFVLDDRDIKVNSAFEIPKKQHYNYDMFGGMTYKVDIRREFYDRVVSIKKDNKEIDLDKDYTIVMNNYRSTNTSIYPSYENAKIVKEINLDVGEVIINYLQKNKQINLNMCGNYEIIY